MRSHIKLTPQLQDYLQKLTAAETPVMAQLRQDTLALGKAAQMQIDPVQGQIMAWLLKSMNAKRMLEIGTFTGYSALWLASAAADARVICCDINDEWADIARRAWATAGLADQITLHLGDAKETFTQIKAEYGAGSFDAVFIDADKGSYPVYYETALELLRPDGLIMIDNVLWHGDVADPHNTALVVNTLRALNTIIATDPRVEMMLLPIGDGLLCARKL